MSFLRYSYFHSRSAPFPISKAPVTSSRTFHIDEFARKFPLIFPGPSPGRSFLRMQQHTLLGHVVRLCFLLLIAGIIVAACGTGSTTTALSSPTTASDPTGTSGATPAITATTNPPLPSPTTTRPTVTPTQKASAPFPSPTPTRTPHPPTPTPKPSPSPTAPPPTTVHVSITFDSSGSFIFSPAVLTIQPNTTVVWKNMTQTPHTVSSDNGTTFDSGTLAPGGAFSFTFKQAGSFAYHCQFHPYMTASITVS